MTEYRPEFINEMTKIVITTRNDNPSIGEYNDLVLPRWRRCDEIAAAVAERGSPPTLEEMREVYHNVLVMLRVKMVPEAEIRGRFDEAFERCNEPVTSYPVARAQVEAGGWEAATRELASAAAARV